MKKTLLALSAFLFVACNTGSPYSAEPLSSAAEVVSSDMSSVSLPSSSSECAYSAEIESSSSSEIFSSSSLAAIWGWDALSSFLWKDRGVEIAVEKYAGDSLESVQGRFWILKGTTTTLSSKEESLLEKRGISIYDRKALDYNGILKAILLKSDSSILKRDLNEDVDLFYNAIPAIDTGFLPIIWSNYFVDDSTNLEMEIYCWPDINSSTCADIVEKCGVSEHHSLHGGTYWYVYSFDYTASASVCDCLSRNRNIQYIKLSPMNKPA